MRGTAGDQLRFVGAGYADDSAGGKFAERGRVGAGPERVWAVERPPERRQLLCDVEVAGRRGQPRSSDADRRPPDGAPVAEERGTKLWAVDPQVLACQVQFAER